MYQLAPILALALAMIASPAAAQIVVTGGRTADACPPSRVAPDRGTNARSPRRMKNPYFAARPVYPPVERGARASINFEPYTSKYYPRGNEYVPPAPASSLIRSR